MAPGASLNASSVLNSKVTQHAQDSHKANFLCETGASGDVDGFFLTKRVKCPPSYPSVLLLGQHQK